MDDGPTRLVLRVMEGEVVVGAGGRWDEDSATRGALDDDLRLVEDNVPPLRIVEVAVRCNAAKPHGEVSLVPMDTGYDGASTTVDGHSCEGVARVWRANLSTPTCSRHFASWPGRPSLRCPHLASNVVEAAWRANFFVGLGVQFAHGWLVELEHRSDEFGETAYVLVGQEPVDSGLVRLVVEIGRFLGNN